MDVLVQRSRHYRTLSSVRAAANDRLKVGYPSAKDA
jgi:hypothetical protein